MDEYGFERPDNFDHNTHESFMSEYLGILARRSKRWSELKDSEKRRKTNTLKRYVRKGIPIDQRPEVWMGVSGAKRNKDSATNNLKPYKELKKRLDNRTIIEIIEIDLPRTFPDNIFFTQNETLPSQLFNILAAFAHQNSEVGYCQGLNYIAGLLLLATKNEETSFWLLKTLVEDILPKYYIKSMSGLITDLAVLDELVSLREPVVYRHIKSIGMPWAVTSTKWFICLYAEVLPTETVLRIWDCLFYEGSKILFRVALTLIRLHKEEILRSRDLAEIVGCFKNMGNHVDVINCHVFMKEIFKLPGSLSSRTLEKLRRKHSSPHE